MAGIHTLDNYSWFKNDLQGRDTNLFPLVCIGTYPTNSPPILISTNATYGGSHQFRPILLNIPSLKESIDIEKRNYKISSVNIDISNFPYEGTRFSEMISDSSLINTECRIYWVSPSCADFQYSFNEVTAPEGISNLAAFPIYFGTIRRYTHDDEKVRLVVEDRSQATLHRDLPLKNVGTENVPDKYKNKYVPMVYGHVEKSPVVPHYSITEEVSTDEGEVENMLEFRLKVDTQNYTPVEKSETIGTAEHKISALYFYENDSYHNVHRANAELGDGVDDEGNPNGEINFRYGDTDIVLDVDGTEYGVAVDGDILQNDFVLGRLRVHAIRRFNKIKPVVDGYQYNAYVNNITVEKTGGIGKIYGSINLGLDFEAGVNDDAVRDYSRAYFKCFLEPITVPNNLAIDAEGTIVAPTTRLLANITHYNFYNQLPDGAGTGNIPSVVNDIGDYLSGYGSSAYTHWAVWVGDYSGVRYDVGSSMNGYGVISGSPLGRMYPHSFNNIDGNNNISQHHDHGSSGGDNLPSDITLLQFFKTLTSYDYINLGIPRHGLREDYPGSGTYSTEDDDRNWGVYTEIFDAFIVQTYLVMGVTDKDYYANVIGRAIYGGFAYATTIIPDILNELGQTVPEDIGSTGIYDWHYAFTVDKKINSKKLIEGLASASPYIPRFTNMGEFKLTEIPEEGGTSHKSIKEADVIDFSFSRTPIEDVYTKIVFRYNWDYAREEFNDSVAVEINDVIPTNYVFDYYGFADRKPDPNDANNMIHPDSTLTIDDDRGKYIREKETAQDFAEWNIMWSCNQHLKMKVKLPLKYMNLEIGDLVDFDAILGGVAPYGIDYTVAGGKVNGQTIYLNFLITSTNKTLEWVEIECLQMHNFNYLIVPGCMIPNACNYDANANSDDGSCAYTYDCANVCGGTAVVDCCNNCNGGAVCDDCGDCPGTGIEPDECGVCGGDNSSCEDCAGTPNGDLELDCNGVCNGFAELQGCDNVCQSQNYFDCTGYCGYPGDGSFQEVDACGVCGGNGDSCLNCSDSNNPNVSTTHVKLYNTWYNIATTTELDLTNNIFVETAGQIDPNISCLVNLRKLLLGWNNLSGEIPSSIGNLTYLKTIHLERNHLTGSIPPEFENLTNLEYLDLYSNRLSGEIPLVISTLPNLKWLILQNNDFEGEIPSWIGNLANNLRLLDLSQNNLTGEIPPEIGNLTSLTGDSDEGLILSYNELSGLVPESICDQGDSTPVLHHNKLCKHLMYFYPDCMTDYDIQNQDTSECEDCLLGDMNGDGLWLGSEYGTYSQPGISDVWILQLCVLEDTCETNDQWACAGDMNNDGGYTNSDVIELGNCILAGNCGG